MSDLCRYIISIISDEMQKSNIDVHDLARQVLITPLNLQRVLMCKYEPSLTILERILNVLNLDLSICKK